MALTIEQYCNILKAAKDINMPQFDEADKYIDPKVQGIGNPPMSTGTAGGTKLAEPKTLGKM